MSSLLEREIRQQRPFAHREEEVYLNIRRSAEVLAHPIEELLRKRGISETQYNVLRILRGAGERGLPCGEIAARLITRDPDVTRLLDRLERNGLSSRCRGERDRRVIQTTITEKGLQLLDELENPLRSLVDELLGHLSPSEQQRLIALLEKTRAPHVVSRLEEAET